MSRKPKVVAFDIIDTVFSLDALRAPLQAHGLAAEDVETLYAAMLRDAMALGAAGGFAPLADILGGALDQLRVRRGLRPDAAARAAARAAMTELDPHPEADACFRQLRAAGFAVHALSNGARRSTEALIARAGFQSLFDGVHSVEGVETYKPHRAVYLAAAGATNTAPDEIMLVATHAWDCHGAKRAGLSAGFVQRGQDWPPAFDPPDVVGESLVDVAAAIVAMG